MTNVIPQEFIQLSKRRSVVALCTALFDHEPYWHWQNRSQKEKRERTELTTFVAQHVLERGSFQQVVDLLSMRSDVDEMTARTVRALVNRLFELGTPPALQKWLETVLLESDYNCHDGCRRWLFCLIEQALVMGGQWPQAVMSALFVFARPKKGFDEKQKKLLRQLFSAAASA